MARNTTADIAATEVLDEPETPAPVRGEAKANPQKMADGIPTVRIRAHQNITLAGQTVLKGEEASVPVTVELLECIQVPRDHADDPTWSPLLEVLD